MNASRYHDDIVESIARRLTTNPLFHSPPDLTSLNSLSMHIVSSMSDIEKYRDPEVNGSFIRGLHWNDVLRKSGREYNRIARNSTPQEHIHADNRVRELFFTAWPHSEASTRRLLGLDYSSDVSTMVNSIMYHCYLCGMIPGHFDTLCWEVLKCGGFPCGWYGGDDGMLAVYVPAWQQN